MVRALCMWQDPEREVEEWVCYSRRRYLWKLPSINQDCLRKMSHIGNFVQLILLSNTRTFWSLLWHPIHNRRTWWSNIIHPLLTRQINMLQCDPTCLLRDIYTLVQWGHHGRKRNGVSSAIRQTKLTVYKELYSEARLKFNSLIASSKL